MAGQSSRPARDELESDDTSSSTASIEDQLDTDDDDEFEEYNRPNSSSGYDSGEPSLLPTYAEAVPLPHVLTPLLESNGAPPQQQQQQQQQSSNSKDHTILETDDRGVVLTRLSSALSSEPRLLRQYLERKATTSPPHASVHIRGWHMLTRHAGGRNKKIEVVDFDFYVDVSDTLVAAAASRRPEIVANDVKTYRGTWRKVVDRRWRAADDGGDVEARGGKASLDEWCHLFCASASPLKSFTLRCSIAGRNEALLRKRIESFLRNTHYRGHIAVSFPLSPRAITITTPHLLNRWRHDRVVYYLCIVLQLWIITWPLLWLLTKRWDVVKVRWPWAPKEQRHGAVQRVSDEDWCRRWRRTICAAAEAGLQREEPVPFVRAPRMMAAAREEGASVEVVDVRATRQGLVDAARDDVD